MTCVSISAMRADFRIKFHITKVTGAIYLFMFTLYSHTLHMNTCIPTFYIEYRIHYNDVQLIQYKQYAVLV